MKTTVTEEFDGEGRLTKRTTVTDGYATGGLIPTAPERYRPPVPAASCTCWQPWGSVTLPAPCPLHGGALYPSASGASITINTSSDATPEQLASEVSQALRSFA